MIPDQDGTTRWEALFFQAEDGIRAWSVTGVQTCALPISAGPLPEAHTRAAPSRTDRRRDTRSEERRVGKSVDLGGGGSSKKKLGRWPWPGSVLSREVRPLCDSGVTANGVCIRLTQRDVS